MESGIASDRMANVRRRKKKHIRDFSYVPHDKEKNATEAYQHSEHREDVGQLCHGHQHRRHCVHVSRQFPPSLRVHPFLYIYTHTRTHCTSFYFSFTISLSLSFLISFLLCFFLLSKPPSCQSSLRPVRLCHVKILQLSKAPVCCYTLYSYYRSPLSQRRRRRRRRIDDNGIDV